MQKLKCASTFSTDKHETIFEKRLEVLQKTKRSLDDAVRSQTLDIIRQLKLKREMSCGMQIEQKMQSPGQQKQENTLYEQRLQTQPQQAMEQIPKGREKLEDIVQIYGRNEQYFC